jgi:HPt (histidine-containing phosphotransfer) domain-containing protein
MGLIDTETGLMYCGDDEDIYNEVLGLFVEMAVESRGVLQEALDAGDIHAYVLRAHALKSNSRNVGALPVGDLAEKLELAGKEGNEDFIKENHQALLDLLVEFEAEAKELLG